MIPHTFAPQSGTIPLSQLDDNFNAINTQSTNDVQHQVVTKVSTTGIPPAYAIAPSPVIDAYVAGVRFNVKFTAAGAGNDLLTINSLASPPNLIYGNSSGTYSNVTAGMIPINWVSDVILLSPTQALVVTMPPPVVTPGGLGYGQSWVDVTLTRSFGVNYTNSTTKPISVYVYSTSSIQLTVGGVAVSVNGVQTPLTAIVPPGVVYSVAGSGSYLWTELR